MEIVTREEYEELTDEEYVQSVKDNISDCVSDLLYYGRKEDSESLPMGKIEDLVARNVISVDDMVRWFREALGTL